MVRLHWFLVRDLNIKKTPNNSTEIKRLIWLFFFTFSTSYSSMKTCFSASPSSRHIWPITLPSSQSLCSGWAAFTESHIFREYRIYGINGFSGAFGGRGARASAWDKKKKKNMKKSVLNIPMCIEAYRCTSLASFLWRERRISMICVHKRSARLFVTIRRWWSRSS